jgi:DNA repair and recombination protein RAD54B
VDLKSFCASKVYEVLIIGYERLRLVVDDLKKAQPAFGLIICDEGHRLKGAGTKTVQALKALTTPRRIILSGTPIQVRPGGWWSCA